MIDDLLGLAGDHVITVVWLKATLFMLVLLAVHAAARRRPASARALFGTGAVAALLLLSAGQYLTPKVGPLVVTFPAFLFQQSPGDLAGLPDRSSAPAWIGWLLDRSLAMWLAALWIAGAIILLARVGWQTWQLARIAAAAEPAECASPRARVFYSAAIESPLTFGWLRPRILLPVAARHWRDDVRRAVLAHEHAHVARRDYLTFMATEVVKALYWINPLTWRLASAVRAELECACDDAVLRGGVAPDAYARHLVDLARRQRALPSAAALPMARRSHFRARVGAILDRGLDRRVASLRDVLAAAIVSLALASSLSGAGLWACPSASAPPVVPPTASR